MFIIAVLIGLYSYCIFALGLLGLLTSKYITVVTIIFLLTTSIFYRQNIASYILNIQKNLKSKKLYQAPFNILLILLLFLQVAVNMTGALGPELGFDALWYHLTLPKLYLLHHAVFHISGGLLYYSDMPKLAEMLYVSAIAIHSEIAAKILHFGFGILSVFALYTLSKKFFSETLSLVVAVIFYSNLVVAWESTTTYVDLTRTFFEIMAFWAFIEWWRRDEKIWLIKSALMTGFAITTKLLAFGSLFIFLFLITVHYLFYRKRKSFTGLVSDNILYTFISLLIPLPWLLFSYIHTKNFVYPFFTSIYPVSLHLDILSPLKFLEDTWYLFTHAADPISALYIILFPLLLVLFKKLNTEFKIIGLYVLLSVLLWYVLPRTGGGRFILPYLPIFSILAVWIIRQISLEKHVKQLRFILYLFVVIAASVSIGYRTLANAKYLPVILGQESKSAFLQKHLNFSFGDFYDTDGYFKDRIKQSDTVLLYGFHNLYYIDFSYIDSSWVKKGDRFTHIAVQNAELPRRFIHWELVYKNDVTHVKLYWLGDRRWVY